MKNLLILLLVFANVSCKEGFLSSNETITFDDFSLVAPSDWHPFKLQGYDSKVGGISNGKDELTYSVGWFSYNFKDLTGATHIITNTIVDGRKAVIVRPKQKGNGVIGLYVQLDTLTRLTIYGTSRKEKEILRIIESVKIL